VGELLAALGPRGADAVTSASRTAPLDRAPVRVSTTKTVQVAVDGLVLPIRTSQSTVRDVLGTAGITLGKHDRTSVPLGAAAVDGMVVMVSRGDTDADRKTEVIPFETERVESDELPKGYEVVQTTGVPGERVTTYEVRTLDGAEVERTVLDREVTREPVDEVVLVGTLDISTATPDPGSAKAIGKAMAAEVGAATSTPASRSSGTRSPAGAGTPRTRPAGRTASRRPCPARRWRRPARTGAPTRRPRSSGAWATSRAGTAPRAGRGATRCRWAGTDPGHPVRV
jgi:hypothetical protein